MAVRQPDAEEPAVSEMFSGIVCPLGKSDIEQDDFFDGDKF